VKDEVIIPRCAEEGRVWITADEAARREHEHALKRHFVSALWVQRPKAGMSSAYQHALLAAGLLRLDYLLTDRPDYALHYKIGSTLHAVPSETWRQRRTRR
jgi:hypothetical protein